MAKFCQIWSHWSQIKFPWNVFVIYLWPSFGIRKRNNFFQFVLSKLKGVVLFDPFFAFNNVANTKSSEGCFSLWKRFHVCCFVFIEQYFQFHSTKTCTKLFVKVGLGMKVFALIKLKQSFNWCLKNVLLYPNRYLTVCTSHLSGSWLTSSLPRSMREMNNRSAQESKQYLNDTLQVV